MWLSLNVVEIAAHAIEAVLPDGAVVLGPRRHCFEWSCVERAGSILRTLTLGDQASPFEHPNMFRHRWQRHVEWFGQLGDACFSVCQPSQDGSPGWIS